MGLRLFRRGHDPARAGRHARLESGPLVPGAAAALMAAAYAEPSPPGPVAASPERPTEGAAVLSPPTTPDNGPPGLPARAELRAPDPQEPTAPPVAPVTLGFADGAQVDLHPDDPRVRTFRAAAAALLESPRS